MPLVSKAQARWMFATHPAMAREWASVTPSIRALPERKAAHVYPRRKRPH